jgi:hypothetical protein
MRCHDNISSCTSASSALGQEATCRRAKMLWEVVGVREIAGCLTCSSSEKSVMVSLALCLGFVSCNRHRIQQQ